MNAAELKKWRERCGYTQDGLAKALMVHPVTVARWETEVREIPPFLVLALETLERRKLASKKKGLR